MKNVCKRCKKEFEFPIPQSFCSSECKNETEQKTCSGKVSCLECQYTWTPKSTYPRICPKCGSANWDGKGKVEKSKETVICMKCGCTKKKDVAACPSCKTLRSELGHWCGITLSQKESLVRFLKNYQGEDPLIRALKGVFDQPPEQVELSKVSAQVATSKVSEQVETCIDDEDPTYQLILLDEILNIVPIPQTAETALSEEERV